MQSQNVKEYEMLRAEMLDLKSCVTTYVGFVLGGIGAAFLVMGRIATSDAPYGGLCLGALGLSLVVSFVLSILMYKFNSHNRFAGYCKLLAHERYVPLAPTPRHYLCWEICMDWLRESDQAPGCLVPVPIKSIDPREFAEKMQQFSGRTPTADRDWRGRGLGELAEIMFTGSARSSSSWRFPTYVCGVFLLLVGLLLAASLLLASGADWSELSIVSIVAAVALHAMMWAHFVKKLAGLMSGSCTVDASCWKFLPLRYRFLVERAHLVKDYDIVR